MEGSGTARSDVGKYLQKQLENESATTSALLQ